MLKKGRIYLLLLSMAVLRLNGQDVHFSQYYFSPLSLNPAYTGKYKGDYRFFANYRSQWKELGNAYNTFSAGGDMNLYPQNLNLSPGLIFINDQSGGNLMVNKILPSGAYHGRLAGFHVHAGVQPGIVMKSIDFYRNSFPEQLNWETGKFDHTLPNSETGVNQKIVYFDLNTGLAVSRKFGAFEPEIGFAAFHVNNPRESFLSDNRRLPGRQAYNLSLTYNFGSVILNAHSVYGYTSKVSDWIGGLNVEYVLSRNAFFTNSVFGGYMYRSGLNRNPDANIVTIGFNYSHYTIGFSYDITRSQLKTSVDSRGAFELALIYRAKSTRLNKKILPCERY